MAHRMAYYHLRIVLQQRLTVSLVLIYPRCFFELQIMCEQHISFGIPFKPTKNYTCVSTNHFFLRVSIQKSPSFFSPVRGVWRCSPATKNSRPRIRHHSELLSPELASWVWWNPMCRMRPSLTIFGQVVLRELVRCFFWWWSTQS